MAQYPQGIFQRLDWLTKKYKQLCCLIRPAIIEITLNELNELILNTYFTKKITDDYIKNIEKQEGELIDQLGKSKDIARDREKRTKEVEDQLEKEKKKNNEDCYNIAMELSELDKEHKEFKRWVKKEAKRCSKIAVLEYIHAVY